MLRNNNDNKINSIIGPEVEVDGDVTVIGSILIYGKINGGVKATGSVRTAKGSYIKGNIESKDANISGNIDGDINVKNKSPIISTSANFLIIRLKFIRLLICFHSDGIS